MSAVPDPRRSRAVLIGTAHYDTLPPLASIENNLSALAEALCADEVWGLPAEHMAIVADPATHLEMLDPLHRACDEATDTLLLYYAGDGLIGQRRAELYLALVGSTAERIYTAVPYGHIRDTLLESRAIRRIVILDCCYSGRALGTMADPITAAVDEAGAEGTYVLAASAENQVALAPGDEPHTAFTGELLRVFHEGIPGCGAVLDLDTIYKHVRAAMRDKGRPLPQKRMRNTAGELTLIYNAAHSSPAPPTDPAPKRAGIPMSSQLVEEHPYDRAYHHGGPRAVQGACSWHGGTCREKVVASVLIRDRGGEAWHAVCQRALDALRSRGAAPT